MKFAVALLLVVLSNLASEAHAQINHRDQAIVLAYEALRATFTDFSLADLELKEGATVSQLLSRDRNLVVKFVSSASDDCAYVIEIEKATEKNISVTYNCL